MTTSEISMAQSKIKEYLLLWLVSYGQKWVGVGEASTIDVLVDDESENCYNYALNNKYIYQSKAERYKGNDRVNDKRRWKLTPKGIRHINE
jgi:hypothetical protein